MAARSRLYKGAQHRELAEVAGGAGASSRIASGCVDDDVITVVGEYTNHYIEIDGDWKICKSELVVHWSHGNAELFVVAKERSLEQLSD